MSLWDYLVDRGDAAQLEARAERVGRALATVHRSQVSFERVRPEPLTQRVHAACARARRHLEASAANADLGDRLAAVARRLEKEAARLSAPLTAVHGRFGFDCVQYDVDGGFNLYRFEDCGWCDPGLDLGGFLADLLSLTSSIDRPDLYTVGREALLAAHGGRRRPPPEREDLPIYIAVAILERLGRLNSSAGTASEVLLRRCEDLL
jgi:hypothetical protein